MIRTPKHICRHPRDFMVTITLIQRKDIKRETKDVAQKKSLRLFSSFARKETFVKHEIKNKLKNKNCPL